MTTWRIAWRNVWRNPRRTALAVAAIALSVTLVLLYNSMVRGYGDWMVRTMTGPLLGHAQVHAPGWRTTRAMDTTLTGIGQRLEMTRQLPGIADVTARIYAPALAARGEAGFVVVVVGVNMHAESQPDRLLAGVPVALPPRHVLIGAQLAKQLDASPGDVLAIVGQGADGSVANDLVTIAAEVNSSVEMINRQAILMDLAEAQTLFAMPDEAHEIVVYARDVNATAALASTLSARPEWRSAEVLDWRALAPELVELLNLVEVAWVFVLLLVFVAAAAGVANTMLMATFERMHEFGMLLALGTSPWRIVRMIGVESLALGMTGAVIGSAAGVLLVALTHEHGIDYATLTGGGPSNIAFGGLNWSLTIYPTLAAIDVIRVVVAVIITSLVASAWPAARVARLEPATALRA